MIDLQKLVRPNILNLKPYSSARSEYKKQNGVFLDANENPYGTLNRYPDPDQKNIKTIIANRNCISVDHVFVGNGSDEVIDLAFRIFCNPSVDSALIFNPSYGMYSVSANINNVNLIEVELDAQFDIDFQSVVPYLEDPSVKLLIICSPNNPTGNTANPIVVEKILTAFNGIVIIDEAYVDFASSASWVTRLGQFPNLIISQTMSKAWGLASARIGFGFAQPAIIELFNKVKPPYNVSQLNQKAATDALYNVESYNQQIKMIQLSKIELKSILQDIPCIEFIYPSDANFFLIMVSNPNGIYKVLIEENIIVRNRHSIVRNCLRITIGTQEENRLLVTALKRIS